MNVYNNSKQRKSKLLCFILKNIDGEKKFDCNQHIWSSHTNHFIFWTKFFKDGNAQNKFNLKMNSIVLRWYLHMLFIWKIMFLGHCNEIVLYIINWKNICSKNKINKSKIVFIYLNGIRISSKKENNWHKDVRNIGLSCGIWICGYKLLIEKVK